MNNLLYIVCWVPGGICADVSDFFEMLGPILIFGIYIIATIVKAAAQKGKSDESGEENESDLKKAIRRRYQEIYQKQTGRPSPKPPQPQGPPPYVQSESPSKTDFRFQQLKTERQRRQEETRQRETRKQEQPRLATQQRRQHELKRVTAPLKRPLAGTIEAPVVKAPRKHTLKTAKTSGPKISPQTGNILAEMISDPKNLQTAFVLKEILDKPVALRDGH